ncbi:TIGR02217 family protein [Ehrlichia ruminantium]|nr:TIGR02217 family protein [Ehrlichia ruminantium]QLK51523.1 TIGR02217 family protein [Ehrlichia ruminantium]QLK53358.1 TIGR02217 family protein [Ehrlichia ruminantium]QLK58858.1 TIGR02217 family protein [Ehrlichia ruminantium]
MVTPMTFYETRFPEDISYGSTGGPEFTTSIIETNNGYEYRKINISYPRNKYNIMYSVKSEEELLKLINFFYIHKGKAIGFRFKDWADYKTIQQKIGIGDNHQTTFQLIKTYKVDQFSYIRTIAKPVINTVKIYYNDSIKNNGFSVNLSNGQIKFDIAPKDGIEIFADYEFDVPVRFDSDYLPYSIDNYKQYNCNNITLIEVKT